MSRRIAFVNQKGGVGKTTSVINVGAGLALAGQRVLVVDLDPQAHLTYGLGVAAHQLTTSVYDLFRGRRPVSEVLCRVGALALLPANLELSGAEMELAAVPGREFLLREALGEADAFDFVLVDCPPSLGLLALNALTAAQEVFIPFQTEFLALQGTAKLLETVRIVGERLNRGLAVTGVIATRFDRRKTLHREVVDTLEKHFPGLLFSTAIRDNIALAEAPSHGLDIFRYRPDSNGASDYRQLCAEILSRRSP